ncbi:MAG TPA: ATP-grasp domain-containing protein [Candidatus Paceibacterota bacterium]
MKNRNFKSNFQRIIIDSQSNPHFLGEESEQNYDQRAALSQGGKGDIVITTNPIDPEYIEYWKGLNFEIPVLITAGPYKKEKVLSNLIFEKEDIQKEITANLNRKMPRLEFFTPSINEEILANHLNLPTYINFDFAKKMQKKSEFKKLCREINIHTLPYVLLNQEIKWKDVIDILGENDKGYIAKHIYGTGGAGLGTIIQIKSENDFNSLFGSEDYIIEKLVDISMEITLHWEIDFNGKVHFINFFEQLAENISFVGTIFPIKISKKLWHVIYHEYDILTKKILELKGLGFMCCDIIIDNNGDFYWSDLNPRKGAILYVYDTVNRFLESNNINNSYWVRHKQIKSRVKSFSELKSILEERLSLKNDGIIISINPGLIQHGKCDLIALSFINHEHSLEMLSEAERLIN